MHSSSLDKRQKETSANGCWNGNGITTSSVAMSIRNFPVPLSFRSPILSGMTHAREELCSHLTERASVVDGTDLGF